MIFAALVSLLLIACSILAIRWGGIDERLAAGGFVLASVASTFFNQNHYISTEEGVLAVDCVLLFALIALALRSDRFWPLWASAFQLVGTMIHFARMFEQGEFAWAYYVGSVFWTYPVLLALMVGSWVEARRRREWDVDFR